MMFFFLDCIPAADMLDCLSFSEGSSWLVVPVAQDPVTQTWRGARRGAQSSVINRQSSLLPFSRADETLP